jgi:cytochrome c5
MYNSSDSEDDTLSGAEKELPQGVYFHKQTGKYRLQFSRGGKLHQSPYSTDIDWLVQWKADKNKELDEAGVPPTRKQKKRERAAFQSDTPGVRWDSEKKRWTGTIYDRLTLKTIHTSSPTYFVHEKDCADAVKKLRVAEEARFEAEMTNRVAANPKLAGLPRAPKDPKDAEKGTVYWHVHKESKYVPYRAIVTGSQTNEYHRACEECHQMALSNVPKGPATHCIQHGGGKRCLGPLGCTECPLGLSAEKGKKDVYDGRCVRCFCASFPDDPRAKRARSSIHVRENVTTEELKKHFPDYNWVFDKTFSHRTFLVGVSTRFRPDARTTQGDRVIIIEIDEQSHRGYLCAKEREREESFVKQNRNKTVVMIRFNPDEYTDYEGVRHPSCFTNATKDTQVTHLHPKRKADWQTRIQELVNTVRNVLDPKFPLPPKQPDRHLLICELFYDDVMATPEDRRVAKALAANKAIGKRKRDTS